MLKKNIFFILFFLFLSGCSQQPVLPRLMPGDVIVAFGDSLTYGTGATQESSYPAVLEKLIGFRVINAGIPGETTEKSLQRLPDVLAEYKPALVILCIGGNDILHRKSEDSISHNLNQLIGMIKASGASTVLIAVPTFRLTLSAADFYEVVAKNNDVPVDMSLLPKLLRTPEYKFDTIHLNEDGYRELAKGIAVFLKDRGAIPQ